VTVGCEPDTVFRVASVTKPFTALLSCGLLDLEEVAQHLLTRGAVDADLSDGAIPTLEMLGQRCKALEATSLQGVGFHVATTPLGHAVFLWVART
jgi:hypothetical protein